MNSERFVKFIWPLLSLLTVAVVLLCLLFNRAGSTPSAATGELLSGFDMHVNNAVSRALDGVLAVDKVYWLREEDLVAPEPNPACFGETDDPTTLDWLIQEAQEKLGFDNAAFSTGDDIFPGSTVKYYLDDTIFAITWKEIAQGAIYTFSEVKVAHPSQFRRFLSGGEYGSGVLYTTSDMAAAVNAVTASSGDYYSFRPFGTTVYNGKVCRYGGDRLDTCFVDGEGDLHFVKRGTMTEKTEINAFVQENNIRFSLAFGPILLEEGEVVCTNSYPIGEVAESFSRAALCQQGPLHYVLVTSNMEPPYLKNPTIVEFAKWLRREGIDNAYALDGGQTAVIVTDDTVINRVDFDEQRRISDIIYFATALPEA